MTAVCPVEQELCPISRGDTIPFTYNFKQPDGSPMDITFMTLTFSMRLDVKNSENALEQYKTFPNDQDSRDGLGSMKVSPILTKKLLSGRTYCYKFVLDNSLEDVFTVGRGKIKVWSDPEYPEEP